MSVKSWLKEFYPVECTDESIKTNLQAVQHSLKKWRGLTDENLSRHRVNVNETNHFRSGRLLSGRSNGSLRINDQSCALCHKHSGENDCKACPINRVTGKRCDQKSYDRVNDVWKSPWHEFQDNLNPEPMIAVLERTEAHLIKEQTRKR